MNHTGNRLEIQRALMEKGHLFKLICGAGNEDASEVYKLCLVYTLAGAKCIDMSANVEVVNDFIALTENCEIARYAPASNATIQNDYDKAVSIISDLEKQINN